MKHPTLVLCGFLSASCLIAESPADFPNQPEERPTIVTDLVIPTTTAVLGSMPGQFLVPVKLLDPTQTIWWQVFVDFDPGDTNQDARALARGTSTPGEEDVDPTDPRSGLRRVTFSLPVLDPAICHTIEFVTASGEFPRGVAVDARSVDPLQSDSVTWFFNPAGDLAGCPTADAPVPPVPDAGTTTEGQGAR